MTDAEGIVGTFFDLKRESGADLLAMQMGDFYEFFGEDAELVGEELDLKVSKKSSGGKHYAMAGVPVADLTPYLKALVERGYRVAVADQFEVGGDIEREVVRVVTPGTLLEPTAAEARYLAAVVRDDSNSSAPWGLAFAEVSTGRFLVASVEDGEVALSELYRFDPVEVLPGPDVRNDDGFIETIRERTGAALTVHDAGAFASGAATHTTRDQFGDETLDSLGLEPGSPSVRAAGAILSYVEETATGVLASMTRLQPYGRGDEVTLDGTTRRNLELTETMRGDSEGSLLATLDHTITSAGGRLLWEWIGRPTRDRSELQRRQTGVATFAEAALAREEVRELLGDAYDLARLASRATSGSANARDLLRVRDTLDVLPALVDVVGGDPRLSDSPAADLLADLDLDGAGELHEELDSALAEEPPGSTSDGGLLRRGYDDDLDGLIDRHEELKKWFDALAERVKRQYSLSHVTVDRNRTDGYYVQVGRSAADGVPEHFREIKTLKNSKRFTTDELDEREREFLRLEERRGELERELFEELRERVGERAELLQDIGRALAEIDVLAALATHAVENGWIRPELHPEGTGIEIVRGRHPVVEATTDFVPNDAHFADDRRFLVVTGPNMSGKSTYMRQTALIVLLAQVGSFVPAEEARIGLVDGIFTRVGALDELAQGRSTFMVEMQELSNILHATTDDSLVILDEVGRGTATYDGISIAWAATEYLSDARATAPSPWTLFATHYHELTTLAEHLDTVENVHMAADERDGDVTFLRTVREGPADRSYGIHVAELAGVPDPVVGRAREVLRKLREEEAIDVQGGGRGEGSGETRQVVFDLGSGQFRGGTNADGEDTTGADLEPEQKLESDSEPERDPGTEQVLAELEETNLNTIPPVELLAKVQEWQKLLNE